MADIDQQVYEQLRIMARNRIAAQKPGHTLQPTALVNEAWMKLRNHFDAADPTPGFFKTAADAMRQILIDHARSKSRQKRGGAAVRVEADFEQIADLAELSDAVEPDQLLALNDAIGKLEQLDEQTAQIVKLRFFTGLTVPQTATVLGVSETAVKRGWQFAKAWLAKQLAGSL